MLDADISAQAVLKGVPVQPPPEVRGLADIQPRAQRLLQELQAFNGESRSRSNATFVLCCMAMGLLAVAAGTYAWLERDAGPHSLRWYWLPLAGGVTVLSLAVFSMVQKGSGLRAPRAVVALTLVLFVASLQINGAAPLLFMAALVIFLHLVVHPREALVACSLALGAALLIVPGSDHDFPAMVLPRAIASGCFALLVMQLLIRRNLSFQRMTHEVSTGLAEVVQALSSDLFAARQARDQAEQALAAKREADERLDAYTRLTTEALQCMTQGLAVMGPDGRLQLYNERHCQLLDLPRELLDTKPLLSEIVAFQARRGDFGPNHESVQSDARDYVKSLGAEPQAPVPPKYLRKTGDGRFLEIVSHRTASGYLVRTYSDVTAYQRVSEQMTYALADREVQLVEARKSREAAEEALQAREQAEARREQATDVLHSVVQAAAQGLFVIDRTGHVLVFNDQVCDMLQIPRALLESRPHYSELLELQRQRNDFDPSIYERPEGRDALPQTLEAWGRHHIDTYTRRSADGRHLEVRTQFISKGYLVRTYSDVSRYVEASLRLEQMVLERDVQLQAARVAREQASQALVDLQAAQQERDRASAVLMTSLDTIAHGVIATDADGRISVWNDRALDLLDLPASLVQGRPLFSDVVRYQLARGDFRGEASVIKTYLEKVLEPEEAGQGEHRQRPTQAMAPDVPRIPSPLLHRLAFGQPQAGGAGDRRALPMSALPMQTWPTASSREPSRYTRQADNGRHIEVTTLPMPSGGVIRTYSDVTEYVQANQKLEESLEQLRTVELQLKSELGRSREMMDLQTRFVASVSHEIRTPLNGIAGMVDLLEDAPLAPEDRQTLNDLRASTRQLRRLTDDILDLARMRDPKFRLEVREFSVWQQVRSCVAAAQAVGRRKGLPVELDLRGPDFTAVGDPERFAQILNNLLFNAVKFTLRGAVRVSGSWELALADPSRTCVDISVADSGRGIDPAVLPDVFEPFHQGEESINRNFGGTGLGLALSRELCEAMGGHIQVSSRPNHGSVFSFRVLLGRVSVEQDQAETRPVDLAETPDDLAGLRVLVVDDNRINQRLLQTWLKEAGAEVVAGLDGAEGLRLASAQTFDCVLMDMSMPVMNGLQATQAIRRLDTSDDPHQAVRAWVPVIGVTAMARKEDRQLCLDAGMNAHLAKPFDRLELLKTVRKLVDDAAWLKTAGSIYADAVLLSPVQDASRLAGKPGGEGV